MTFRHPVGLAAGFDKNAEAIHPLLRQGFAFVEAGSVTPRPQPGNPTPRLFRLAEDRAVINRMGFNNAGLERFIVNLEQARRTALPGWVGVNLGKNKDTQDPIEDYLTGLRRTAHLADYVVINVSSPNTPGLRDLQQKSVLGALIRALKSEGLSKPLLVKLAPDMADEDLADIAMLALAEKLSGVILTNTTITRPASLQSKYKAETGGLSGAPLMERATESLRQFHRATGGQIPLIGVGGVASAADAYQKIRAGASLVQLYSALVYEGMDLVPRIVSGLAEHLRRDGFTSITDAIGTA